MSKSEQLIEQEGRYGVDEEVCFHFPLDSDDFFIDVISWIASRSKKSDPSSQQASHPPAIPTNRDTDYIQARLRLGCLSQADRRISLMPTPKRRRNRPRKIEPSE